ncbi:MAG: hypothetical protein Q9182_003925 [Xanthomendoza sp. 2 TL-2023]
MTASRKPIVLLLGEILQTQKEWNDLAQIAELRVSCVGCASQIQKKKTPGARASCISVSNTPGVVNACTANTAIFLLLGALRRAHVPATALRQGRWRGSMGMGHDPDGKMLGILGMGGIGSAFALRAAPFDFTMQYHNRHPIVRPSSNPTNAKYVSFEQLLRTSDVISIHLPLNSTTRGLIGRKEFGMMKDGVVIVNTARGKIIDEEALVEALEQDKVFAAGLDVYEEEPEIHPGLIKSDKVVLMPHVGTATIETQRKMEMLVIDNIRNVLQRGSLLTPVVESRKAPGYECNCVGAPYNVDAITSSLSYQNNPISVLADLSSPRESCTKLLLTLLTAGQSKMYNMLIYGVTAAVIAVLGLFHREILSQTITSGDASFFTAAAWENPFAKKSLIEMSDASIAFFADRFVPAIIPGSTSTGRPYIVSLFENANVTVPDATPFNTSDPRVLMSLIKASMHVDREPFTWIQGLLSVAIATMFIFTTIIVVGLVIWYRYRIQSKMLQKMNITLLHTNTALQNTNSTLHDRNTTQYNTIGQFQTIMSFVERLCTSRTSEPLAHLKADLHAAGQIPYLPNLISHIDIVLSIIENAQSNTDKDSQSQRVLTHMREERDATLLKCEDLEVSLAQKTDDFDELGGKLKKANASNEHLQSALDSKAADFNDVCGERDGANKKCGILESKLGNTQQKLQAVQAKLDTILYGASDIEESNDDDLKDAKFTTSGAESPAAGFNPTTTPSEPVRRSQTPSAVHYAHWYSPEQPEQIEGQDPLLPTSNGTNDSGHNFAPASKGSNAPPSHESMPARGRSDSPPTKPSPLRARGSPIRSTMGDLYERANRNQAADAAAALYGGAPRQPSDKDSVFVQPQLRDHRGGSGRGRGAGPSSARGYRGGRGGRGGRGYTSGLQAPPGVDDSPQASFARLEELIRKAGSGQS